MVGPRPRGRRAPAPAAAGPVAPSTRRAVSAGRGRWPAATSTSTRACPPTRLSRAAVVRVRDARAGSGRLPQCTRMLCRSPPRFGIACRRSLPGAHDVVSRKRPSARCDARGRRRHARGAARYAAVHPAPRAPRPRSADPRRLGRAPRRARRAHARRHGDHCRDADRVPLLARRPGRCRCRWTGRGDPRPGVGERPGGPVDREYHRVRRPLHPPMAWSASGRIGHDPLGPSWLREVWCYPRDHLDRTSTAAGLREPRPGLDELLALAANAG